MRTQQYSEEELKRLILGGGDTPDFWEEYDNLTTIPSIRHVEEINEWNAGDTLIRAYERVQVLNQLWIMWVEMSPTYTGSIRLIYRTPQTREEYINDKIRQWRNLSSRASYKHYLFSTLWLRNESSIRNIFVKLLLEHKISLEDFADLVQAKDIEVDLVSLCGWQQTGQNYFI